jgi:hypothetical protein
MLYDWNKSSEQTENQKKTLIFLLCIFLKFIKCLDSILKLMKTFHNCIISYFIENCIYTIEDAKQVSSSNIASDFYLESSQCESWLGHRLP